MGNCGMEINASDKSSGDALFVARQPIVDRSGATVAYELLFRSGPTNVAVIPDDFLCTAAVVERAMNSIGLDRLIGDKDAYLNCSDDFLVSKLIDVLPPERFVLELLETSQLSALLAERCKSLRRSGFRIALDDVFAISPAVDAFLPSVDIVKIDWLLTPEDRRAELIAHLKKAGKQVIAEKIEFRDQYDLAMSLGCDFIQGFYFSKPQLITGKKILPSAGLVLHIVQLLLNDAPLQKIVDALSQAPLVAIQLLRLANSGAMPNVRVKQFASLGQAFSMVGSAKLLQWCSVLLYANPNGLPVADDPLVHLAEQRARFMAFEAKRLRADDQWLDQAAYLTGMLSLLHVAYGIDIQSFVDDLPLEACIKTAIAQRSGELGEMIDRAEQWERAGAVAPKAR